MIEITIDSSRAREKLDRLADRIAGASSVVNRTCRKSIDETRIEALDYFSTNSVPRDAGIAVEQISNDRTRVHFDNSLVIPIENFESRQTASGVEVFVERGSAPILIEDAFGPDVPRLRGQIVRRKGTRRLPLRAVRDVFVWSQRGLSRITHSIHDRLKRACIDEIRKQVTREGS